MGLKFIILLGLIDDTDIQLWMRKKGWKRKVSIFMIHPYSDHDTYISIIYACEKYREKVDHTRDKTIMCYVKLDTIWSVGPQDLYVSGFLIPVKIPVEEKF